MSFNMLAMLYMHVAQSNLKIQSSNVTKRRLTELGRRKPTTVSLKAPDILLARIPKIEAICRVCGKDCDNISIFDQTGTRNIVNDITTIASVRIDKNDGLPTHICAECLGLLNNALLFKEMCEKMDKELRSRHKETDQICIKEEPLDQNDGPPESLSSANENDITYDDYKNQGFFDCLKCSMCFMDKDGYRMHLPTCHLVFEKLCKEKEIVPEALPWLCDVCGKKFKIKTQLTTHRIVHTDELPFACDQCPYRGRNKYTLRLHTRVHTGERPHKCPHCPRTFSNASNQKDHQRVHGGRPRYQCSLCPKKLATAQSLKDHEKTIHFGVRDHECDICGTLLGSKRGLLKHRSYIHKIRALHPKFCTYLKIDEREKAKQRNDGQSRLLPHPPGGFVAPLVGPCTLADSNSK